MATIRYLVKDVERSIAFYTQSLGCHLDQSMAGPKSSAASNVVELFEPASR
jgi:catechol 2,3-dioxygenase-like lactoylglutathione lyase family enzyme